VGGQPEYDFEASLVFKEENEGTTAQVLITFTFKGRTYKHEINASGAPGRA